MSPLLTYPRLNMAHPLSQGLVLSVPFFERGGNIAQDTSPLQAFGVVSGTYDWTASFYGMVPKFNGTDTLVSFGSNPILASPKLSVCILWKDNTITPLQFEGIAGKTNGSTWSQGWGMYWESAKRMTFFVEGYSTNFAYYDVTTTTIWHYYIGTWDGATVRIYQDGLPGTPDTYGGAITATNPCELGRLGTNTYNSPGQCADFKVYNRALLPQEAMSLSLDPWQMYYQRNLLAEMGYGTGTPAVTYPIPDIGVWSLERRIGVKGLDRRIAVNPGEDRRIRVK